VPAGDPASIAQRLSDALSTQIPGGVDAGVAFATYEKHFSNQKIREELSALLTRLV
jgi:hypothetical protein